MRFFLSGIFLFILTIVLGNNNQYLQKQEQFSDTVFFDVKNKTEDLGVVLESFLTVRAEIATNVKGENEIYYALNTEPAMFYVLDAETGQLKYSQALKGISHLYGITQAADKNVYFSGVNDGVLHRYIPAKKKIETLGRNPSNDWVWDIDAAADGKLYGATYGETGSKVFEYSISSGVFKNLGAIRTDSAQVYARGVGVTKDYIYVGVGLPEALIQVDRKTQAQREIKLPSSGSTRMASDAWVYNGCLFVREEESVLYVLDETSGALRNVLQFENTISPPSPFDSSLIYFKRGTHLFQYDILANKESEVKGLPAFSTSSPVKLSWIKLHTGPKAGKKVLALMQEFSEFTLIDPQDGWTKVVHLQVKAVGITLQSLEKDPGGDLIIGGYMRSMCVYNTRLKKIVYSDPSFNQPEGIGFLNNNTYLGTYGGAVIYKYEPTKPFSTTQPSNPSLVHDIEDGQDRPFVITSADSNLFVGSVAEYGHLQGALTVFSERKNRWRTYTDVVKNQSIIGLAYKNGKLYGGTSIWGGLGIEPTEKQAELFVWDVEKEQLIRSGALQLPCSNDAVKMIGSLSFGPDGLLWGIASGSVFAINPDTYKIVKCRHIFNNNYGNTSTWRPYYIRWGKDGLMYSTIGRNLTVIDPVTLKYQLLVEDVSLMVLGDQSDIYYARGNRLMRLSLK